MTNWQMQSPDLSISQYIENGCTVTLRAEKSFIDKMWNWQTIISRDEQLPYVSIEVGNTASTLKRAQSEAETRIEPITAAMQVLGG